MLKRKLTLPFLILAIVVISGIVVQIRLRPRADVGQSIPIRIGYSSLTPIHCMIGEVFSRTKILEEHGLAASFVSFLHGSDQGRACRRGEIDATFSCEVPAIIHLTECPDLRIVATPGSLGRIALLVPKGSQISSLEELEGRRIIFHGGASAHMQLLRWLKDASLEPQKDVQIISSPKGIIGDLLDGSADAIVTWDPWLEAFKREYALRIICERPFWSVIVISQEYLDRFPQGAVRYLRALKEALCWAANHKDQVNRWVAERSHLKVEDVATVTSLNKNYAISREKEDVDILLTPVHIKILEECAKHAKQFESISQDFDLKHYINLQVANRAEKNGS